MIRTFAPLSTPDHGPQRPRRDVAAYIAADVGGNNQFRQGVHLQPDIPGIINGKGKFVREGERILHDEHGMGSYVLAWKKDTGGAKDVVINEVDIDNFIRAKGAIFSATQTMLHSLGFDASVIDRCRRCPPGGRPPPQS